MSYPCPGYQIPYFSSSTNTYNGFSLGDASVRDNTRVLNETAYTVANFRQGGGPPPPTWASRGGSILSYPECRRGAGGVHCWARSGSGTLAWYNSADGDIWSFPANLGG